MRSPSDPAPSRTTREMAALATAESARVEFHFLLESVEALAGGVSLKERLERWTRLLVPRLADWCAVDLLDEAGARQRCTVWHNDPQKAELAAELDRRYPPQPSDPLMRVLRTGQPDLTAEISAAVLDAVAHDEEHLRLIRGLGLRSYMIVPLQRNRETVGAVTLVTAESGRIYDERDLRLVQRLASVAALAVENGRLYERAHREQERYRRLFEEIPHPLYQSTPDGKLTTANRALLELLGYDSLTELQAVHIESDLYVDPGQRAAARQELHRTGLAKDVPLDLRRKDGTTIRVRDNARAVLDEHGAVLCYEGSLTPV